MNDTLGADYIGYSIVAKPLRKKAPRVDVWHGFEPTIKEENFAMKQFLGLLRNTPCPHSAKLPKEYSFQWLRFEIILWIRWGIESGTFDGFPTRSHRAKPNMYRDESRYSSSSPVS
jgi:hypothetical protein